MRGNWSSQLHAPGEAAGDKTYSLLCLSQVTGSCNKRCHCLEGSTESAYVVMAPEMVLETVEIVKGAAEKRRAGNLDHR